MRPEVLIRPQLRYAAGAACVAVILVISGYAVTTHYSHRLFLVLGIVAVAALAVAERGAFMGLLVLAAMNGLPFIDTSHALAHHIAIQDAACLAFIAVVAFWTISQPKADRVSGLAKVVSACGLALFLWCAFIVVRTSMIGHSPVLGAIRYGRDFLYFGALLIFLPRLRLPAREIERLLVVLAVGVSMFSVGQIVTVLGIGHVSWLVHVNASGHTLGLTRVYSPMNDLLSAGIAGGVAAIALARGRIRTVAIPVTLLLSTSLIIQLTRARWIGMAGGLVLVSLWLVLGGDRRVATVLRRRLAQIGMALVGIIALVLVAAPSVITHGALANRFLSIFTDVGSTNVATSTVAVREHVASLMAGLLGGHWLLGLGLIPPAVHYYLALPNGSLRDPDVGALNSIITIGVIGTVLIYLPVVLSLLWGMRRPRAQTATRTPWILYGGAIFIVTSIISSVTLGTLFSVGGLVLTAVVLSLMCQAAESTSSVEAETEIEMDLDARASGSDSLAPDFSLAGVAGVAGANRSSFGSRDLAGPGVATARRGTDLGLEWEEGEPRVGRRDREPIGGERALTPPGGRSWADRPRALTDGPPRQSGPSMRSYRRPEARGRLRLLILGGVLIAALLGFLLARAVLSTGPSKPPVGYASSGPLSVAYPPGWRGKALPSSPGFGVTDEVALGPPGAGDGLLVIGRVLAPDAALLPPSLHSRVAHLSPAQITVLNGTRAFRYLDQTVAGVAGPATIYALPTGAGTILGVCENQGAAAAFAGTCERTVAAVSLRGSSAPAPAAPTAAYASALTAAMAKLNAARVRFGAQLAQARTPSAQAAAAGALATAHLSAAGAIGKLSAGSAQAANLALAGALRAAGDAYRALGRAAANHDTRGYAAARSQVSAATVRLGTAVSQLGKLGTGIG